MAGMKLDDDTLVLYKMLETPPTESAQDLALFGVKDSSAGAYHLQPTHDSAALSSRPTISWGPSGSSKRTEFSRYFFDEGNVRSNLQSAVIDQDFIDAQIADHTWQIYFKVDSGTNDAALFSVGVGDSIPTADDWLMAATVVSGGTGLRFFWESAEVNQRYLVSTSVSLNTWHTLMITRRIDPGSTTHFINRVFLDGVFIEEFDMNSTWAEGDGTVPLVTSGTNDSIVIGAGDTEDAGLDYEGYVAGMRCVKLALSDAAMVADHNDWVTNGVLTLDNHGAGTTLCQYDLNEPPEFLDESPNGFHGFAAVGSTSGGITTYEGSDVCNQVDLVGSTGRARLSDDGNIYIQSRAGKADFLALHGRAFHEFFNDTIDVPEWTVEAYVVLDPRGLAAHWDLLTFGDATGETLVTNWLGRMRISDPTFTFAGFWERTAAGTNVDATGPAVFSGNQQYGLLHLAFRQLEDTGTPGNVIIEVYVNGVLTSTSDSNLPAQGGGVFDQDLYALTGPGYYQELKISKVAVSPAQILENANAVGGNAPEILSLTPASGTPIDDDQTLQFDVVGDVGNAIAVTLIWLKYSDRLTYTVVYDGAGFLPPFTGAVVDTVGDGSSLRFTINAEGRWRDDIEEMRVRALGGNGIVDVEV